MLMFNDNRTRTFALSLSRSRIRPLRRAAAASRADYLDAGAVRPRNGVLQEHEAVWSGRLGAEILLSGEQCAVERCQMISSYNSRLLMTCKRMDSRCKSVAFRPKQIPRIGFIDILGGFRRCADPRSHCCRPQHRISWHRCGCVPAGICGADGNRQDLQRIAAGDIPPFRLVGSQRGQLGIPRGQAPVWPSGSAPCPRSPPLAIRRRAPAAGSARTPGSDAPGLPWEGRCRRHNADRREWIRAARAMSKHARWSRRACGIPRRPRRSDPRRSPQPVPEEPSGYT